MEIYFDLKKEPINFRITWLTLRVTTEVRIFFGFRALGKPELVEREKLDRRRLGVLKMLLNQLAMRSPYWWP
jgi:hypothetical protein